ncbi:hypothetical protein [Staphylococcus canis]|uniref:Uncharacterized protein n=1 Tax=Staphylococcus canis TaxID=2724942 RepID=A0ABS0TAW9_9STAP|nr:hypothetical protein [Staphylococcus canis]MBI5975695.1 hypothetical protein [Staphylococcus canis]
MSKSKKYFYLSIILILISFIFNTHNPLLNMWVTSIIKLIFLSSVINAIILILAIFFADRAIKYLPKRKHWIHTAARALPIILLLVILIHIISALITFGIFS